MSHLRPIDRSTGGVKAYGDYSKTERDKALVEMRDAVGVLRQQGKPIDKGTAQRIVSMAKGTDKEETLDQDILDAAAGKPPVEKTDKTK